MDVSVGYVYMCVFVYMCVCMGTLWRWCRIINTMRVKEHSPDWQEGVAAIYRALGVASKNEEVDSRLAWRWKVFPSAQEAKEIGGSWRWAH